MPELSIKYIVFVGGGGVSARAVNQIHCVCRWRQSQCQSCQSNTLCLQVEAESVPELSIKYGITAVPTCILVKVCYSDVIGVLIQ